MQTILLNRSCEYFLRIACRELLARDYGALEVRSSIPQSSPLSRAPRTFRERMPGARKSSASSPGWLACGQTQAALTSASECLLICAMHLSDQVAQICSATSWWSLVVRPARWPGWTFQELVAWHGRFSKWNREIEMQQGRLKSAAAAATCDGLTAQQSLTYRNILPKLNLDCLV